MADKIKFELPKFLLYSDNTYVSPSTLPVGPTSKGPNLARGREEYNKGNYTDSDAQAYAKKISGKAEIISPEFDFISAIGLGGLKHFLFKFPEKGSQLFIKNNKIKTNIAKDVIKSSYNNSKGILDGIDIPFYAKPNSPIEQSKQYTIKRAKSGYLKNQYNKNWDDKIEGTNHTYGEYIKDSFSPIPYNDDIKIQNRFNKYRFTLKNKEEPYVINAKYGETSGKGYVAVTNKSSPGKFKFNKHSKQSLVSHEVNHLLDRLHFKNRNPIGFEDKSTLLNKLSNDKYKNLKGVRDFSSEEMEEYITRAINNDYFLSPTELSARGTQIKNYFGLTDSSQEITGDMLRYAAKHYIKDTGIDNNMKEFFISIKDFDEAAKWLSENSLKEGGKLNE